jgi:hypothetical protein
MTSSMFSNIKLFVRWKIIAEDIDNDDIMIPMMKIMNLHVNFMHMGHVTDTIEFWNQEIRYEYADVCYMLCNIPGLAKKPI